MRIQNLKKLLLLFVLYKLSRWLFFLLRSIYESRKPNLTQNTRNSKELVLQEIPASKASYILSLTATSLTEAIRSQEITSVEALSVCILRAYNLAPELNSEVEQQFREALSLARLRDRQLEENPSSCGALHGLPICIRDYLPQVSGHLNSEDINANISNPGYASLLQSLLREGAVPFMKSQVSQSQLCAESLKYTKEHAYYPRNALFSISEGGQAAMMAAKISPLSLDTCIMGSLQLLCSEHGVYGLRATNGRINNNELLQNAMHPSTLLGKGPLGKCVEDLCLILKTVFSDNNSMYMDPVLFNQTMFSDTLERTDMNIGYFTAIGSFESTPAINRSVKCVKEALEAKGHTLVEFCPDFRALKLYFEVLKSKGIEFTTSIQRRSTSDSYFAKRFEFAQFLIELFSNLICKKDTKQPFCRPLKMSGEELHSFYLQINEYKEQFINQWIDLSLDAVICPVFGSFKHSNSASNTDLLPPFSYTMLWDLFDFPSGVVPLRSVDREETCYFSELQDGESIQAQLDMNTDMKIPMGVQVVALPYRDEVALGLMKQAQDSFKFYKFAPYLFFHIYFYKC